MESFYTIQGEGKYSGTAAYFIRLGGCKIGCHWCDVKESWDEFAHPKLSTQEIIEQIPPEVKLVVITGGEPCIYDLKELTSALKSKGIQINLETSGAYEIKGDFDWICLSPKKRKLPIESTLKQAHELKVIIFNNDDFTFAEKYATLVNKECKKYLQVEWSKRDKLQNKTIEYVMQNPNWKISTQTHKYLDIR